MRRLFLICLALAIPVGALVFWKREGIVYHLKQHRAETHLEKSLEASKEGQWKEAERLAIASLQLSPGKIETVRQIFECEKSIQSRSLLRTAGSLFEHPEASMADRLKVLQLYLDIGDVVLFKEQYTQLSPAELNNPDAMALGIRFCLVRNDPTRALALSQKLREARGNPSDQLLEASALSRFSQSKPEFAKYAQDIIADLLTEESEIGLAALTLLKTMPRDRIDYSRFSDVEKRLGEWESEGTEIPLQTRLFSVELKMLAEPNQAIAYLDTAIEQHGSNHPCEVGEWLLEMERFEFIDEVVPESDAMASSRHFSLLVQRDIRKGDWESARHRLQSPHPGIPPAGTYSLLAMVEEKSGHPANAKIHWEKALQQASFSNGRHMLLKLADFAHSAKNEPIRQRALKEALLRPSPLSLATSDIEFVFSNLAKDNDVRTLQAISRIQLQTEPENPLLRNNLIWLRLIQGHSADKKLSQSAQKLVDQFPEIPTLRTTLALAHLEEESVTEALEVVTGLVETGDSSATISDSDKAVIALALRMSGEEEKASQTLSAIDWSNMMDQERSFFQDRLERSASPSEPKS